MNRKPIAVVEPQMEHIFHAPFNAALLHAVALAFPEQRISFRALPSHLSAVQSILEQHSSSTAHSIEWRRIEPLAPGASTLTRWRSNTRLFRQLFVPQECILFCSISRMQLLQLKRIMRPKDDAFAVLHGDLDRVESPAKERFPASLFALQNVLLKPQPRGLGLLVLSQSILAHIPQPLQPAFSNARVIDHPYHFPPLKPTPPGPIVFGIFGNTGDGHLLEAVARKVKAANPEIVFRLVGFLSDAEAVNRLSPFLDGAGSEPLSREEFIRRAESITYALWLAPPGSFRLRASGTFFDALAYGKPLVYTANAFIDPYFAQAPGIGHRCVEVEDVPEVILRLAASHNSTTYAEAQSSMKTFRNGFTPERMAQSLPHILRPIGESLPKPGASS